MKREEAIAILQDKHDECKAFYDLAAHPEDAYPGAKEYMEALQIAIAALRAPTREQVENLQGEWLFPIFVGQKEANDPRFQCSECGSVETPLARHRFCPSCGAPMTDEAVEITLQRLEALHENDR